MSGLDVAARIALHEGDLHVLVREGRRSGVLFTDLDGARRFASILAGVEGEAPEVETIPHDQRGALLHELAWREAEIMVDPEYVAGEGAIAATTPAHVAKALLRRGLAGV